MPKPWKDPEIQNKIRQWVEKNPSRWYTAKYEDIRVETGVSVSTLYRYFPLIVAKVADILPSEVIERRQEHMGISPWRRKLSDEEIAEIRRLYDEGHTSLDISFMTGRSLSQVEKYKPKKKNASQSDTPRRLMNRSCVRVAYINPACYKSANPCP